MKRTLGVAVMLAGATGLSQASIIPISGSGWTNDVIMEAGASFPVGNFGVDINSSVAGWAFYESGYGTGTQGLNSTGAYTGPSGASYQMEAYNANNVFQNGGTFTLDTSEGFTDLAFLVTHQRNNGGTVTWTATLNFSDSSSTVLNGSGIDWTQSATQVVVSNHGLYSWDGNPTTGFYSGGLSIVERTFTLSAADQLKNLESIDFALTGGNNAVFHAISGQAVPEASAAAIFILGALGIATHRRRPRWAA